MQREGGTLDRSKMAQSSASKYFEFLAIGRDINSVDIPSRYRLTELIGILGQERFETEPGKVETQNAGTVETKQHARAVRRPLGQADAGPRD